MTRGGLKMKKSIAALALVLVLLQLGHASPTIENASANTGEDELSNSDAHTNISNLKDDTEQTRRPVVLLIPVENSEDKYDSQHEDEEEKDDEEGEGEVEEGTEEMEDEPQRSRKTKRCKSFSSLRKARRNPIARDPGRYISVSTENSMDQSLDVPAAEKSLFRVASSRDAKRILRNLLKSRATKREDSDDDSSISLVSRDSDMRGKSGPKKYICYCVEEDCGVKRSKKKPSRPYAVKKRIEPKVFGKNGYSINDETQEMPSHPDDSENILGAPNNLRCPPGTVLMEEPEYLAKSQYPQRQPVKKCPHLTLPIDSEPYTLGQPTKIHIPLAGNRKWNRRVYKVDRKSPFAQKLQSIIEQKAADDRLTCPEPETAYDEPQAVQNYYNNEQSNFNQYQPVPVAPNLVYPGSYVVYPQYLPYPQYDGLGNQIALEPAGQGFVGLQEPTQNQYMPTLMGRNFLDIDQCIKIFGPNFCITTTTESSAQGRQHASNYEENHEEPDVVAQSQDESTEKHQNKDNSQQYEAYSDNQHDKQQGDQVASAPVTSPYYTSEPAIRKFEMSDKVSQTATSNVQTDGSKNEEEPIDYDEYLANLESDTLTDDSYESDSDDYSPELNDSEILQKKPEGIVAKTPVIAETRIPQNLQGAHKASSPQYIQHKVKPVEEDLSNTWSENDTSEYTQLKQDSSSPNYDVASDEVSKETSTEDSTINLQKESDNIQGFPDWKHLAATYPSSVNGNHAASTPLRMDGPSHGNNHNAVTSNYELYHSMAPEKSGVDVQPYIPKTASHQPFIGNTQSPSVGAYNNFATSYRPMDNTGFRTTSFLRQKEPQDRTYTSAADFKISDVVQMKTDSSWPEEIEEYEENSTGSMPTTLNYATQPKLGYTAGNNYFLQPKQPESNIKSAITKTITSHRQFAEKPQSIPLDRFSKPGFDSCPGDTNRCRTSYATMADSRHATPLLGANEPEEQIVSSPIYPNGKEIPDGAPEHGKTNTDRTPPHHYKTPSPMEDINKNKYFTTQKSSHQQFVGSQQSITTPSSSLSGDTGANFDSRITSPQQSFVQKISQPKPLNNFATSGSISNAAASYATMESSKYDTKPMLGANKPKVFTSHSSYPVPVETGGAESALPRPQNTGERHEDGTDRSPPAVYYTTQSNMADINQNKWSKVGQISTPHHPFVGIPQTTPANDFSRPGVPSTATIGGNSHYTTSYATMEEPGHTMTSILGAMEPEEEIAWSKQHEDNVAATPWNKQGGIKSPNAQQHFATDKNAYPKFRTTPQPNYFNSLTGANAQQCVPTERNSYPQFGAKTPGYTNYNYNVANSKNWYSPNANQQAATGQSAQRQFVASHHSNPDIVASTIRPNSLKIPTTEGSKTYWSSATESPQRISFPTQSERPFLTVTHGPTSEPKKLGSKLPFKDDINSNEGTNNWYRPTESIVENPMVTKYAYTVSEPDDLHDEYRAPIVSSNQHLTPEDKNGEEPKKNLPLGNSLKQLGATPHVDTHSGIKEESNAYFTSKSYDDSAHGMTGPDTYFEGGGLKNWNDFTSMSAEDTDELTNTGRVVPEEEGWGSADVSPDPTTDFEIVGESDEIGQATPQKTEYNFSHPKTTTQASNEITYTLYPDQNYEDKDLMTYSDQTSDEEVGDPEHQFLSSTPISATHYFGGHSSPETLKIESKVLEKTSSANQNNNYPTHNQHPQSFVPEETNRQNAELAAVAGNTNEYDYDDYNSYSSTEMDNQPSIIDEDTPAVSSTEDEIIGFDNKMSKANEGIQSTLPYNFVGNPQKERKTFTSTPLSPIVESPELVEMPLRSGKITQSDDFMKSVPNSIQTKISHGRVSDVLGHSMTPKEELDTGEPGNYDYTNDCSSLEKPTTNLSEHQDAPCSVDFQPLGNPLTNEPAPYKEDTSSSINYDGYPSSETDSPSKSSESVGAPICEPPSNLLGSPPTAGSTNYDDYKDYDTTEEVLSQPNIVQGPADPTVGSTPKISNEDQLCSSDRNILWTAVETVVNDLISQRFDKQNGNIPTSQDVVGAPNKKLSPKLPELPILREVFSLPEVKDTAVNIVKSLISGVGGVPHGSSLGRLADHLIESVLNRVVDKLLPGPVAPTSSGIVDEHRFENGQWTVVPVNFIPKDEQVAMKPGDKVSSTIENIVGRIGLRGARLPAVQNIIVTVVENILRGAKHLVNNSIIWDTLNNVISHAEKYETAPRKTAAATTTPATPTKPTIKEPDIKKPSGTFKNLPAIPVNERVFENGRWIDKQTVLGAKKKNDEPTLSKTLTTDNQFRATASSAQTEAILSKQLDTTTKAPDYTMLGESDEDGIPINCEPKSIVGITQNTPNDSEENLDNTPIKYYSPNDRILSYIKNHQSPEVIVGSQEKSQSTPRPSNVYGSTENDSMSTMETPEDLAPPDNDESPNVSKEPTLGSPEESMTCTCKTEEEKTSDESVASGLRVTTEAPTEENNDSQSRTNFHRFNEKGEPISKNYAEEQNPITMIEPPRKPEEKFASTESPELFSTVHHLDVDDTGSKEDTTEEYVANQYPFNSGTSKSDESLETVKFIPANINESPVSSNVGEYDINMHRQVVSTPVYVYGVPVKNSEEVGAHNKMPMNNGSPTIPDVIKHISGADNHGHRDQSVTTQVYVYGMPVLESKSDEEIEKSTNKEHVGIANASPEEKEPPKSNDLPTISNITDDILRASNPQNISPPVYVYGVAVDEKNRSEPLPEDNSRSDDVPINKENIGAPNIPTTEKFNSISQNVGASKGVPSNESPTASDDTKNILGANNPAQTITTPVSVYGLPVHDDNTPGMTDGNENTPAIRKNNTQQFPQASKPHESTDLTSTSTLTEPKENVGNALFPDLHGHPEESTGEHVGLPKLPIALTTDKPAENVEIEAPTAASKSSETSFDVHSEILQSGPNRATDDNPASEVYVYGTPVQESTTQALRPKVTKTKNFNSAVETATSSAGSIGAARTRIGKPHPQNPPLGRLDNSPPDDIVKAAGRPSSGSSNCVTPKYDPTYFGKISLNGLNPGGDSISDLTNADLFYVGDGVKIPLTIQRMPDGSYALSISEKICESFVKRKCPCCVPSEGDIVEERRQSSEPVDEDYSAETTSQGDYNYESLEPTESSDFRGKSKKRYVRSTSGCDVVVTSATPVETFVKKYNLTLDLEEENSPRFTERNNKRVSNNNNNKIRPNSSKDAKIPNLFGTNNEIQRDDSRETEQRAFNDEHLDTISKKSNGIRTAEYTFDTGTNDFIETLAHIKDVPEDKRNEVVLNALDGLVNSATGQNQNSMDGNSLGNSLEKYQVEDQGQWAGSDEYYLEEMENEMAKYGYQKDNPILARIRLIKGKKNSHGQYMYQKNIDPRAKGKMNLLKTVLHWLRQLFVETNSSNER